MLSKIFFIADLHFGHKNSLAFDNREFKSIEEHDAFLIEQWNSVVGIDDDVWILGDISWYPPVKTISIFNQLNGIKHLIIGNHYKKLIRNKDVRALFAEITDYKEISYGDKKGIILCHYPIPCFNMHYYGWYHLYGHVHNSTEYNLMKHIKYLIQSSHKKPCYMYNVGCMLPEMNYTPRTIEEIIQLFHDEIVEEENEESMVNNGGV